jgi:hypothetical protein
MLIRMFGKQHLRRPSYLLNLGQVGVDEIVLDHDMAKIIAGAVDQPFPSTLPSDRAGLSIFPLVAISAMIRTSRSVTSASLIVRRHSQADFLADKIV